MGTREIMPIFRSVAVQAVRGLLAHGQAIVTSNRAGRLLFVEAVAQTGAVRPV